MNFDALDGLKAKLDARRPLAREVAENLHEDLLLRWTYDSNAIEGSSLTLEETRTALEGIAVGGKTLREHLEAVNHRAAILHLEELVKENAPLTERLVKSLHQLIFGWIDDENAGRYRTVNVVISGAVHRPPEHVKLGEEMAAFIRWYETTAGGLHPVERAARVHADLMRIHPFSDGNGRIGRLLMGFELMKAGFPPAVLPVEKRSAYYDALDVAETRGDYAPFLALIAETVARSFQPYGVVLGVQP